MKSPRNLVILLQSGTASQNLWEPELAHGALHVPDLPLRWGWCLHPLGRLPPDTTDHVGVGERLGGSLLGLHVEGGRNWLGDARVQRRGPARDDQILVADIAGNWATVTVGSSRPGEGSVVV
jgi:hypothetical protein